MKDEFKEYFEGFLRKSGGNLEVDDGGYTDIITSAMWAGYVMGDTRSQREIDSLHTDISNCEIALEVIADGISLVGVAEMALEELRGTKALSSTTKGVK